MFQRSVLIPLSDKKKNIDCTVPGQPSEGQSVHAFSASLLERYQVPALGETLLGERGGA